MDDPIQFIKGVGPKKALLLQKLQLTTIEDLFYFLPFRYEDRRELKTISSLVPGHFATFIAEVLNSGIIYMGRRKRVFEVIFQDETGTTRAKFFRFNETYMLEKFKTGKKIIVSGKPTVNKRSGLEIVHPDTERIIDGRAHPIEIGQFVPVYHTTEGLHQKSIRSIINNLLEKYLPLVEEVIPENILNRHKFLSRSEAFQLVHSPQSEGLTGKDLEGFKTPAQKRLVFEELFLIQTGLAFKKKHARDIKVGLKFKTRGNLIKRFINLLPFQLTQAQKKVLREIMEDLEKEKPMNRLIQGDVGSGKTIVAITTLLTAVDNKTQAALMVPTEILAEQHYSNIRLFCEGLGVESALVTGTLKRKERQTVYQDIESGKTQIIIGTHSLVQKEIKFNNLGLAVIDEQHRFGVLQREALGKKGVDPHLLIMTATPIPRSLALTLYGDMDVSFLDEFPPGRQAISTQVFYEKQQNKAYEIMCSELKLGRQAFVVCPLIEESEVMDLKAAVTVFESIQERFPEFKAYLIHGKLKKEVRQEIMSKFLNKEIQILVSTTVIEVGIDIPNATVMVIEHAERFGLAQLHQLRGRVGRGRHASHCLLAAYFPVSEEGKARMKVIQDSRNGFEIAEEDLKIRGPGDFMGTRQSGLPVLKIANLIRDIKVLDLARKEAFSLVDRDPHLEDPKNQPLKSAVQRLLGDHLSLMDII